MAVCSSKFALGSVAVAGLLLAGPTPALADSLLRSAGYGVQQALNAGMVAALYSLLAVAYALLHGITNRIVLSFGDIATFGAFYTVYVFLLSLVSGLGTGAALGLVFLAAIAGTAALGIAVNQGVFAPLVRTPSQAIMIASIGLSIVLQEALRLQSSGREQWLPPIYPEALFRLDFDGYPVSITIMQTIIFLVSLALVLTLYSVLAYTKAGRLWRACSQNRELAALCGIDVGQVMTWTAAAAAAFAAASGWIIGVAYGGVSFYMGLVLGLKALFASIIGGFGTIGGAIAGGIVLAGLETAWTAFFPIVYRDVAVFSLVILVLVLKPDGLLGVPARRDSEI
jgi:branched-chain amino acid transport system permease protein